MTNTADEVREKVREYYAGRALSASSCCGDSCCDSSFYSPELTSGLAPDVAEFSLGCGDPISAAALQPGESVLDLGSGGGLDCLLAARQVGENGRVTGVDMTPEMIGRARAAAVKLGQANVEFRQGYLEALPVEDGSQDVVISNCVINLSPEKPHVFREIFRVLKPGGRISVSDIVTSGRMPRLLQENLEAWSACVSGAIPAEEYAQGLKEAGFVDVRVDPKGNFDSALSLIPLGTTYSASITARKPLAEG